MRIEHDIVRILAPLGDIEALLAVLAEMRLLPPGAQVSAPDGLADFVADASGLMTQIRGLAEGLSDGGAVDLGDALQILALARQTYALIEGLRGLAGGGDDDTVPAPFDDPDFWESVADRLPGHLLERWVRRYHPLAHRTMAFLRLWKTASGTTGLDLAELRRFVDTPAEAALGLVTEDRQVSLRRLVDTVRAMAAMEGFTRPARQYRLVDGRSFAEPDVPARRDGGLALDFLPPGLDVAGSAVATLDFDGVAARLGLDVTGGATFEAPLADGWRVRAETDAAAGIAFRYAPDTGLEALPDVPAAAGHLSLEGRPDRPWRLIGLGESGPKLTLGAATLTADAALAGADPDFAIALELDDIALTVTLAGSDSFIAEALPIDAFEVRFDTRLDWSAQGGLAVSADRPEFRIPLNLSFGPFSVPQLNIALPAGGTALGLDFGLRAKADLGIIRAVVENIGVTGSLSGVPAGTGALGDMEYQVRFLGPTGIGIAFGTEDGPVSGGGYLNVDRDAGRYEGILDLRIVKVGITAVVIIDTEALDSGAWSMFFALFITMPSIPLVFGITLDGVGGVAGIHRTLDAEALLAAARSGAIDTVLFPDNPIEDAPIVIDTFRSLFPPAQGRFVFGPVVRLGWAKGAVSAELGVVIEVPDPIIVATLGSVKIELPVIRSEEDEDEDEPGDTPPLPAEDGDAEEQAPQVPRSIIGLRFDVAGIFDFGAGTVAMDAFLHDSTIAGFPVTGGMSLRIRFKGDRLFLVAVGGFHPGFPQPENFPLVPRIGMGITVAEVVDIGFEGYFAIASNTVQFGSAIHLMADVEIFRIEGGFAFDALFEFEPFRVTLDVDMYVSVSALGIDLMSIRLTGSLVGPKPWTVAAHVEVNVIGYRNGFDFVKTTGAPQETAPLPPPGLLDLLVAALSQPSAWEAAAPEGGGVLLADPDATQGPVPVSPDAVLQVTQRIAPLDLRIDHFSRNSNLLHDRFLLTSDVTDGAVPAEDWFAPGLFRDLGGSDAEKLAAPSFEAMQAGISFGGALRRGPPRAATRGPKVVRVDPELGFDPADLPPPPQVGLRDRVGPEAAGQVLTSGTAPAFGVADVVAVDVAATAYVPVSVATGLPAADAQSFAAASAANVPGATVLVRGFEAEAAA